MNIYQTCGDGGCYVWYATPQPMLREITIPGVDDEPPVKQIPAPKMQRNETIVAIASAMLLIFLVTISVVFG